MRREYSLGSRRAEPEIASFVASFVAAIRCELRGARRVRLGAVDLLVLGLYMALVVALGMSFGRRQRTAADYMLGGRDVPWWAVLLSIVATETSTVTFLSIPGWAWAHDLRWLQLPLGYIVGRLIVVVLLLPHYFRGEVFTAYQVLHRRFGGATKQVAASLFLLTRTLADGLRLYLSALVLREVFALDMAWSIVVLGALTILYTFHGGMRAVVWTDVIQFVVYIAGAGVAFAILLQLLPGGFDGLLADADARGKLRMFDTTWTLQDPFTLWAGLLGGAFVAIGSHGADQMMVQRYLCARSQRQAAWALGLSGVVVWLQFAFFLLIGIGLWSYYAQHPPARPFVEEDRVFASFIVTHMPAGLLGVVLGAIFSAAMSTLSSSLNSSATAMVHDLWLPLRRRWSLQAASDADTLRLARRFTIVFGLLQITVALVGSTISGSVVNQVMAIASFTTGVILGVFFLAIFTRRATQRAALVALIGGLCGMSLVVFALPPMSEWWFGEPFKLAWPWWAVVGSLGTLSLGVVASLVLPPSAERSASRETP